MNVDPVIVGATFVSVVTSVLVTLGTIFITTGKYKEKVDRLENESEKKEKKIEALRSEMDRMQEFKTNTQKFIDKKIYESKSPLKLTKFGKKLVNDSGLDKILEQEKEQFIDFLEKKKPATRYDVQEKAREVMTERVDYKAFEPVKTYAFDSGSDYEQILRAGGILLRDYYLEKHSEIQK